MTRVRVPVLAGELIELTRPARRDCGRLHLRRGRPRAADRGEDRPSGTLVCIDRDPAAEDHFEELSREVACDTRFLRMDYAEGLALLREEELPPTSSISTSASPRCRSTRASAASPTPTTRRSTCAWIPGQELDAREIVNTWDERQLAQLFRRLPPATITTAQLSSTLCADAPYMKMRMGRLDAYGPKEEAVRLRQYCATAQK